MPARTEAVTQSKHRSPSWKASRATAISLPPDAEAERADTNSDARSAVIAVARPKVGTIERLMIDKVSGKVAYAVLRFGGFMGVGKDPA